MNLAGLRPLLVRNGTFAALVDRSELRSRLTADTLEHVGAVCERLEPCADPHARDLASLRLTVLLHELPPRVLAAELGTPELSDHAAAVLAVVAGFGELWHAASEEALAACVARHRTHVSSLLLFELVHEGAPTAAMRRTATIGGLAVDFERWTGRL